MLSVIGAILLEFQIDSSSSETIHDLGGWSAPCILSDMEYAGMESPATSPRAPLAW